LSYIPRMSKCHYYTIVMNNLLENE